MKNLFMIVLASLLLSTSAFALDTCYTGSYYEPATDGEGIALQVSEDRVVLYRYAHFRAVPNYWVGVLDNDQPDGTVLTFRAYQTLNVEGDIASYDVGTITLTPNGDAFDLSWDYDIDISKIGDPDVSIPWCLNSDCSGSKELISLFRTASCE